MTIPPYCINSLISSKAPNINITGQCTIIIDTITHIYVICFSPENFSK